MDREKAALAIFSEMLRLELPRANDELYTSYFDGGRASGLRNERLARAVSDAYAQTNAALYAVS